MTTDPGQPRSRRALLAGGLGATVAALAASLGRPSLVDAGSDGDIVLGHINTEAITTTISNLESDINNNTDAAALVCKAIVGDAIRGESQLVSGVVGKSDSSTGVFGVGKKAGVAGIGRSADGEGFGVHGVNAYDNGTAIHGEGKSGATTGVLDSVVSPSGTGVRGMSASGTALAGTASAANGFALKTDGRVSFGKVSGVATIAAGKTARAIIYPGTDITSSSYVLLTPQRDPGTRRFWAVLSATSNSVTIKTNDTRTYSIRIAWLLVG